MYMNKIVVLWTDMFVYSIYVRLGMANIN